MHFFLCIVLLVAGCISPVSASPPIIEALLPEGNLDAPSQVKAMDEDGFTLECRASGKTPITMYWEKDGKLLAELEFKYEIITDKQKGVSKLKVQIPRPSQDNGNFQCFAENAEGKVFSRKIRVVVTYIGKFTNQDENYVEEKQVTVGQPFMLKCPERNTKYPQFGASYYWGNKDSTTNTINLLPQSSNIAMTQNGNLVFLYVTEADLKTIDDWGRGAKNGTIQCNVQAGTTTYTSHKFLLKQVGTDNSPLKPVFVQDGEPKTLESAIQGKSKALFCVAQMSPAPNNAIRWVRVDSVTNDKLPIVDGKNGFSIPEDKSGRNLIISQVSKEQHEGVYQCIVENNQGKTESQLSQLKVFVPPGWIVKPPPKMNIPMYGGAVLLCEAFGDPTPAYGWYVNGSKIVNSQHLIVTNNKLTFKAVELYEHAGIYQCVAENDYGMVVSTTVVEIDARKPGIIGFGPFYIFKDTKGEIKCDSNAAPAANHVWSKDDQVLSISGRYSLGPGNSLVITPVQQNDEGKYTCKATNLLGTDTKSNDATVYERTKITVRPDASVELIKGKPTDFRCQATADPRLMNILKYKWLKDGTELQYTENINWIPNQLRLKLSEADIDDGAVYTCVAYTDDKLKYSEDRASSIANVQGVPFPPSNLTITNCYNLTTVITWVPGSSTGKPITHYQIEQESEFEAGVWQILKKVDDPKSTSLQLQLTPWAKLRFRMRAVNSVGPSRASLPTPVGACETKVSRPTMVPKNFRGVPGKANELDAAWTPLTKLEQNAPGCKYVLKYRKSGAKDWQKVTIDNPSTAKYSILNPGYYELWEFMIYATNDIGDGPQSDIIKSRSGQDAPKDKPKNLKKGVVTARTVSLTWDRVTVDRGSVDGYISYHWFKTIETQNDQETPVRTRRRREIPVGAQTYKLNATSQPSQSGTVRGLTPFSSYTLVLKAFNSGGEGPESDAITFDTNEDVPGIVADVDVTPFAKYIFAQWGPPLESNGVLLGYAIAAVKHTQGQPDPPMNSVKFTELGTNKLEHLFEDVEQESHYIIYLKAKTRIGYGPVYTERVDTIKPSAPAKPRAPFVVGYETDSVNVTFLFGKTKGGYPTEFKVKYRNKASSDNSYKETSWSNHFEKRWVIVGGLSQDLYEFITVGRNDLGESIDSPPADGRPVPYVGVGQRATPLHKSTWFIVLLVLIALLLLFVVIVVLYRKRGGAKYQVGKREKERAGMLDQMPDEEDNIEMAGRGDDNPPPYSDGSIGRGSDDDKDSLDDYGEGPQFKEDGSFIEEYGDDKKKLTDGKNDKNAAATFV
ncbi:fibronectin type III domain-containing protein [Nematostella vectensis]|nr:fibronectin type III domain-containing protein [Nematostella vectensis]